MKTLSILTLTLSFFTACQSTPAPKTVQASSSKAPAQEIQANAVLSIPSDTEQLLVVSTASWNTRTGTLQRYNKIENKWQKFDKPIAIILGRNGLGWGKGLHTTPTNATYIKKEGDGRAPAGLFALGNGFGYNNFKINFPYQAYKTTDHCVDDSKSQWYNQIIDSKKVTKDYKSFEHMKLRNHLYRYGITVNHNPEQIANAGSCIFMHIRSGNGKGTAGCTAMKENEMIKILKWLREEKKPLLLQLPAEEILKIDI